MPRLVDEPMRIQAHGSPPKTIEEYVGRGTTQTSQLSVARMVSPPGWSESGQTPDFDEYTVVLKGFVRVESADGTFDVQAGQAVVSRAGEWVRYSTPGPDGAEYVAVCQPAFSPDTVHHDPDI